MRSKRLLAILIIFIILSGIAIIGGTVFIIKDIEINIVSPDFIKDEVISKQNMYLATQDVKGKSILFNLKKDDIKTKIENAEKLVKVINIEAEFPSKVVIDVRERYPVFLCDKISSGGKMVILDAEMRVLYSGITAWEGEYSKLVSIKNTGINFDSFEIGDYAVGLNEKSTEKIAQLQTVSKYFIGLGTNEDSITHLFNEITFIEDGILSGTYVMYLDVKPKQIGDDTKIKIISQNVAGFKSLFAYVWSCLENPLPYYNDGGEQIGIKQSNAPGVYTARYNTNGRLVVEYDNLDAAFPNNPDAVFIVGES